MIQMTCFKVDILSPKNVDIFGGRLLRGFELKRELDNQ